ncbi:MAG: heparinase II/III family protein [Defluviitaleaceae bacterium]|nr:heparinase II/III family protein [Defluviitaleaceae bacterium]
MLSQVRTAPMHMFPTPRPGETICETPPAFCWLKVPDASQYRIIIEDGDRNEVWRIETEKNMAVPDFILPAGTYRWNLWGYANGWQQRGWQDFTIAAQAVPFLRPTATEVLSGIPAKRPRHLFAENDIEMLRSSRVPELETLRRNVKLALTRPIPSPPMYHVKRESWQLHMRRYIGGKDAFREDCDRDLVACALAAVLLDDAKAAQRAREVFLTFLSWNPDGPCSPDGDWGDEPGLSLSRCLPAVYDLLYHDLDDNERRLAESTMAKYAALCERRLLKLDFLNNPGDSHAGRIPSYLGEAALVLHGTGVVPEETLKRWLSYALDIFGSVFPHFGGPDGGWAEGVFYGSSYTKWYLPFMSAVARFSGKNFLDRPFFQRLPHYFLHFAAPGRENHPFCDGYWCNSDDDEWPGFYAQNPFRIYANRTGPGLAKDWAKKLAAPEIFRLHLLDIFLPDMPPPAVNVSGQASDAHAFPDAGYAALHTDLADYKNDTALLLRASRYGAVSHQHADQGSFALVHGDTTLITPSGYFGAGWGTPHHFKWMLQTQAHNCILIDGQPQPREFTSTARIVECGIKDGIRYAAADLTEAYPMLTAYTRSYTLEKRDDETVAIIRDVLSADKPVTVAFLNHTLSLPECHPDGTVTVKRNNVTLSIKPKQGLLPAVAWTDQFETDVNEGIPPGFEVETPPQYHLRWESKPAGHHDIVVEYVIK